MTAEETFNKALGEIYSRLGKAVTYTPAGGDPVTIRADVTYGANLEDPAWKPLGTRASATLGVKNADVPDPQYKDTVLIEGVAWTVLRVLEGDGFTWKLEIERDVRATFKK